MQILEHLSYYLALNIFFYDFQKNNREWRTESAMTYKLKVILFFILINLIKLQTLHAQLFNLKTESTGLSAAFHSNGISVADYDLDGDLDVYIVGADSYSGGNPDTWNRLFRNEGDGAFTDVTEEANVRGAVLSPHEGYEGGQFAAAWGDYDNDGDPDLILTNFGYNIFYKNNGDGTFTDISKAAGIKGPINDHTSNACWWDFDLDGDLDLYLSAYIGRNLMFENTGSDTFNNITVSSGLGDRGNTWSSLPFDANNDGLIDLYVINDFGPNHFYLNNGDGTFTDNTEESGLVDEGHGMGVTLGDYNNDGLFDIYLTNISNVVPCPLFENQGDGTFIDKAVEAGVSNSGWAWGTNFFDFDNDGDLDLYVANGHREEKAYNFLFYNMMINNELSQDELGPYFLDLSDTSGANSGEVARALVTFDYDDDGDLDMLVGNWWTFPHLYENVSATKNWIKIELEGTISNRNAFGSSVEITCGIKKYYRPNDGIGLMGQSILPLHFGLGDDNIIDSLKVKWPNGVEEIFTDIEANRQIKIVENQGLITGIHNLRFPNINSDYYHIGSYPNPFNNSTNILFNAPLQGNSRITIYDIMGRIIFSDSMGHKKGENKFAWSGINNNGSAVSSGLYFYSIKNDFNQYISGKLMLLK